MPKYGIIKEGHLYTNFSQIEGYKPIYYAEIPEGFDQTTHYIIQTSPVDKKDYIFVGIETHELEIEDEEFDEDVF